MINPQKKIYLASRSFEDVNLSLASEFWVFNFLEIRKLWPWQVHCFAGSVWVSKPRATGRPCQELAHLVYHRLVAPPRSAFPWVPATLSSLWWSLWPCRLSSAFACSCCSATASSFVELLPQKLQTLPERRQLLCPGRLRRLDQMMELLPTMEAEGAPNLWSLWWWLEKTCRRFLHILHLHIQKLSSNALLSNYDLIVLEVAICDFVWCFVFFDTTKGGACQQQVIHSGMFNLSQIFLWYFWQSDTQYIEKHWVLYKFQVVNFFGVFKLGS